MTEKPNTPDQKQTQNKPGADRREGQPGMKHEQHDQGKHDQEQGQKQGQKPGQQPGQRAEGQQNQRKDDRKDQPNR